MKWDIIKDAWEHHIRDNLKFPAKQEMEFYFRYGGDEQDV